MRPARLHLRCTDAELATWRAHAVLDGRTLSDWIRRQLNADNGHEPERVAVTLEHPAISRASGLAAEREHFQPDPKPSQPRAAAR